ncbi:aminotransferase class V-fold PLP-dependent enzyme [Streptacidiphilus sp. PB12-B1b]|uniref:aminotransferase class V-fold PLP-dependent enzyme n=1 Tax=Streptacidiphilus sp. PB12-B1b TaxID=2705012 RepID=UPI0015F7A3CB|nr:aminotransferase class V-fold PLP-dependent enzyme [Streptacidiphilus sp. PB12-B1b]QMU76818.1 aminotransferase class V-fold PLP-dependent enzyme [Streptacidiphilus sp. PB12-B1b]
MSSSSAPLSVSDRTSPFAAAFPGLRRPGPDGRPFVHADAPGGAQVTDSVITAMADYLRRSNANPSRGFTTSVETAELIASVRDRCAGLVGADPGGVVFGPSSTMLIWHFARAFAETLDAGDNIVCTQLDHEANVSPWLAVARSRGAEVRFVPLDPDTFELDYAALPGLVDRRTRLVAFTRSSNLIGSIVRVEPLVEAARSVSALTFSDGVAAAAHRPLDQLAHGIDVSVCSAYKFFGPHLALLTAGPDLLDRFAPDRIRPAAKSGPRRWEMGTLALESLAGLGAAVDYLTATGYPAIAAQERELTVRTLDGLRRLRHVRLHGLDSAEGREPIFAVTVERRSTHEVASLLADRGVFVAAGDSYATECAKALGLPPSEGAVRFGLVHYHGDDDVDRILEALDDLRPGG